MWLHKISIRGLKSIAKLDIEFDQKVTLIYGQNGMGKTTILEAISLLGHLPTMRQIRLRSSGEIESKDSRLFQMMANAQLVENDSGDPVTDKYVSTDCFKEIIGKMKKSLSSDIEKLQDLFRDSFSKENPVLTVEGVENLFADFKRANNEQKSHSENFLDSWFKNVDLQRADPAGNEKINDALIRFEVSFHKDPKSRETFSLFVFFRNVDNISITTTLGRKAFNDKRMNDTYALIWEEQHDEDVTRLLDHLAETTKFLIPLDKKKITEKENLLKLVKYAGHDEVIERLNAQTNKNTKDNIGFTFYLNTDLNDFGRGRDVRESVKDIFGDFIGEWIDRLGINFAEAEPKKGDSDIRRRREFKQTGPLQEQLNSILNPSIWRNHDEFILKTCAAYQDRSEKWKPDIEVERHNKKKPVKLDFLSAGENECFFIFMYLLGTNINNSICLLDEPDLHLSQFSKKPFYEGLYGLLARNNNLGEDKNCQVIISTHSGFAYSDPEITERLHIRKQKDRVEHESKHDFRFTLRLALLYIKTSFGVLGWTATIYLILLAGVLALASDIWTAFAQNDPQTHVQILQIFVYPIFYFLGVWHAIKLFLIAKKKLTFFESN